MASLGMHLFWVLAAHYSFIGIVNVLYCTKLYTVLYMPSNLSNVASNNLVGFLLGGFARKYSTSSLYAFLDIHFCRSITWCNHKRFYASHFHNSDPIWGDV